MHATRNTRVLIADDHPMVRRALSESLLQSFGESFEVLEAGSAVSAREVLATASVDLLLLDLSMPGMDGARSLQALRRDFPSVPILVVSAIEEPQVMRQTMELGVAGFLPKSSPFAAITDAVRAVLAGELWFPELGTTLEEPRELPARIADLTPQQRRVLELVCQGRHNKEIAVDLGVTEATIKAHVTQILQKLGVRSRTQAALLARQLDRPRDDLRQ
jgi:DNA-binding NarL/FixJ family response regulator